MATFVDLAKLGITWPKQSKLEFERIGLYPRDGVGRWLVNGTFAYKTVHETRAATMADVNLVLETAVRGNEGFCFAEISECLISYAGRDISPPWSKYHDWPIVGDVNPNRSKADGHVRGYAITIYEITSSPDAALQFIGLLRE